MQSVDSAVTAAFERVSAVFPAARSVGISLDPARDQAHRYHAVLHHDAQLSAGCVIGYGCSSAAALDDLCEQLVRLLAEERALTLCVTCAVACEETPGEVTTGDGMMCSEHAIEWLQSERQAADEGVGPCGQRS